MFDREKFLCRVCRGVLFVFVYLLSGVLICLFTCLFLFLFVRSFVCLFVC